MHDFIQRIPSGDLIAVVIVVVAGGGILLLLALKGWFDHRKCEIEAELKHDMIAAGMSAEEIIRVLEARGPSDPKPKAPTGP